MSIILEVFAAVLNSLWQAALAAALVWAALRWLRPRFNAATRYVIWWAALGVILLLPAGPRAISLWQSRGTAVTPANPRATAQSAPLSSMPLDVPVVVT